jgi:RHS repeat-associated protein
MRPLLPQGLDGQTSSLPGIPSGSWSYNQDDEQTHETYDQDGNVTASGGKTFSYDSQNEMLSMNGGAVQMVYDGDGNRVAKSVTSGGVTTTTQYLVDDLNPTGYPQVMDELTNGAVTRTYTYGLQRISEDQIVNGAWTPSFYSYDGMGSVRQLTNTSGTVTDSYEYDAFGNQISHTGTTPNNYLYRGEQYDSDLGLYYLRARYYNPATGRFMSRDPNDGDITDPATLHKYLYANSDPVDRTDPSGRAALFEGAWLTISRAEKAGKYGYTIGGYNPWPPNVPSWAQSPSFLKLLLGGPKGCLTVTYFGLSVFFSEATSSQADQLSLQDELTQTTTFLATCLKNAAANAAVNPL